MDNLDLRVTDYVDVGVDDVQLDKCIRIINRLNGQDRRVIQMRYGANCRDSRYEQICKETGLSYFKVKRRIRGIVEIVIEKCVKPYVVY